MISNLPDLQTLSTMDLRLRQVATDPDAVGRAIEMARVHLSDARSSGDRRAVIRALGYLGEAYRLAGRFDEADVALTEALLLARSSGDARSIAAGTIRLGELRRCQDRYPEAEALLREAATLADDPAHSGCAAYRDFALQHLGKTVLDAGRPDEAIALLERALTIRTAASAASLIASTEQALSRAKRAARAARTGPDRSSDRGAT